MATRPAWHVPFAIATGGAIQVIALVALYPAIQHVRSFLVIGLGRDQWFVAALGASALAVMVGLGIACARLENAGRGALSALTGLIALFGTIGILYLGFFAWIFAAGDRAELAAPDGRSIVVNQFCWHHCTLGASQRDGIFIDNELSTEGVDDVRYTFTDGGYTMTQVGDTVTIRTEQGAFSVILE